MQPQPINLKPVLLPCFLFASFYKKLGGFPPYFVVSALESGDCPLREV